MKLIVAAALVLISSLGTAQAFTNCVAQAEHKWNGMTIEAASQGDTCSDAVLVLAVRDKAGKPVWVHAYIASQLLSFTDQPATDAKAMVSKLSGWISGEGFMQSADKLNVKAEFPFVLAQDGDAKNFDSYRKQKRPIFCFVQGMESGACLLQDKDGGIVEIGTQGFPG